MTEITYLTSLDGEPPERFLDVDRVDTQQGQAGATQYFFTNRTIYDATAFAVTDPVTDAQVADLGHVIVAPSGYLGFDPEVVIGGTVNGATPADTISQAIADGKDADGIWQALLSGDDTIHGDQQDLNGYEGNDTLMSDGGFVTLNGGDGDDVLYLSGGEQIAVGGAGSDTFFFSAVNTSLYSAGINDYDESQDHLVLDSSAFAGLGDRITAADSRFAGKPHARTADDHLLVGQHPEKFGGFTVTLAYDPDGNGPQAAQTIAVFHSAVKLRPADFQVASDPGRAASPTVAPGVFAIGPAVSATSAALHPGGPMPAHDFMHWDLTHHVQLA